METLPHLPEDWDRALAVVAHPDDLEYGAASAIARWTSQGKEVVYSLATRGEAGIDGLPPGRAAAVREAEQRRSAEIVGVSEVGFLGFDDGTIEYGVPLRREITRAVRRYQPEIVVTINHRDTWGGSSVNHADHRAVGWGVIDAVRDAGNRWLYPELTAGGLEHWDGVRLVAVNASPEPTHAVDVTDHLEAGIRSLRAHEAYLGALGGDFDPDRFLRSAAEHVGGRAGCRYAVAFEVIEA